MRNIVLAVILGLSAGWILPQLFRGKANSVETPTKSISPSRREYSISRFGPSSPNANSGLSLDEQRREWRAKFPNNPYRVQLFSMGLVSSLSVEELVTAFRAGQLRDSPELAEAFARIAQADPILALKLLREIPARSHKDRAQSAILKACVENDPAGFFAHLKTLEASEHRSYLIDEFALLWAEKEPVVILSRLKELEEIAHPNIKGVSLSLISDWAKRDFEAAVAWVENLSEGKEKEVFSERLLVGQLDTLSGDQAVDFILSRPESTVLQKHLGMILKNLTFGDPEGAVRKFSKLPKKHQVWNEVEGFGQSVVIGLLSQNRDLDQVLKWGDYFSEEKARHQFLLGAVRNAMTNDIEAGERLFTALPESRERDEAARDFVEYKMRQDPVALAHWLGALEPSATRDGAVFRFASLLKENDPERAREWAETIVDEKERDRVLKILGVIP